MTAAGQPAQASALMCHLRRLLTSMPEDIYLQCRCAGHEPAEDTGRRRPPLHEISPGAPFDAMPAPESAAIRRRRRYGRGFHFLHYGRECAPDYADEIADFKSFARRAHRPAATTREAFRWRYGSAAAILSTLKLRDIRPTRYRQFPGAKAVVTIGYRSRNILHHEPCAYRQPLKSACCRAIIWPRRRNDFCHEPPKQRSQLLSKIRESVIAQYYFLH